MTALNISIICLSLKHIDDKYEDISNICKWIYYELVRYNYNDDKLFRSLVRKDYEIIKSIIKFNKNRDIFSNHLICFCFDDELKLVKLLIENGADIHTGSDCVIKWASKNDHFDIIKLLIDKK